MLRTLLLSAAAVAAVPTFASAAIVITEVHPTGSSSLTYARDWFELTNTGSSPVNISGFKVDDNSNSSSSALALRVITSIPAKSSVVFIETNTDGSTDASVFAAFKAAWFGASVPASFQIGSYGGSGIGLGSGGDAVNIYDGSNALVTNVTFGSATLGVTFDNTAGISGGAISTASVVGTNGAFNSLTGGEVGSPGVTIPEPASLGLLGLGALAMGRRRRIA